MLLDIDSFYKEIGQRIKSERIKRDISQERLGSHLDLTRASVINLEKGRHRPSLYHVIQIASFFEIDYTALVPYKISKSKRRRNDLSKKLTEDNFVADEELGRSDKAAVNNFLSTIQKA